MTPEPTNLDDLIPPDPLMAIAWLGSMQFALGSDDVLAAFRFDTGNQWEPAKSPIERMIDEACGADLKYLREFAAWHNTNIWGDINLRAGERTEAK